MGPLVRMLVLQNPLILTARMVLYDAHARVGCRFIERMLRCLLVVSIASRGGRPALAS